MVSHKVAGIRETARGQRWFREFEKASAEVSMIIRGCTSKCARIGSAFALLFLFGLAGCSDGTPSSPTSAAAEAEQTYLAMIEIYGVDLPGTDLPIGDQHALRIGRSMCDALNNSDLPAEVIGYAVKESGGFSAGDSGTLMGAAVGSLCPEHSDRLTQ